MSKRFKPVLALVLSVFMSVSTLSNTYTVFAEEETTVRTDEQTNEENSIETSDSSNEDNSQNLAEDVNESDDQLDKNTDEINKEENNVVQNEESNDEIQEDSEKEGDSNMMDYFLVDNPVLSSNSTENFVLSLKDTNGYSDFTITVQKKDGTTFDLEASEQVDKLVKFTKEFSSVDKGEYSVTTLHYTYNGEKYYLNFSDLGMDVRFGVDQEYSGYDETLPDMTKDVVEDDELNNAVIQVTNLDDASEEVAEGIVASDPDAAIGLISEDESATQRSNEGVTICLDPGHGGNDSGAIGINNVYEKNLTLKIAQYCKQELEKYNCKVVMTRTGDTNPSLEERADYAKAQGAKYLISIHLNSAAGGGAVGAEVYYPNTHWRPDISADGKNVAQAIQSQLVSLGLYDRGIKFRTIDTNIYPDPFRYDDGSVADYYGIIRNAKYNGLTGLIIEHCFINNASDYNNYLSMDAKLQQLGVADANGIVSALGLSKGAYDSTAGTKKSILYQTHVQDYGWQTWKKNGEMAGTQGEAKKMEAINIKLSSDLSGNVEYMTHVQNVGWQGWKSNGATAGTTGQNKRLEAIKMRLTGNVAKQYDIFYRVHAQDYGWLGWAKNGERAGTEGYSYRIEGVKIVLVSKGSKAPGNTSKHYYHKGHVPDDENEYMSIMGTSQTSVQQMVRYYNTNAKGYDTFESKYNGKYDGCLKKGGASSITQFAQIVYEEAKAEGVRAEVVFAQCMKETAFLKYGGDVHPNQYNFAGIGATGKVNGASFTNVRLGVRAQVQHLKAYASLNNLTKPCVDPRFNLVKRGSAKYVEWLGKKENPTGEGWATAKNYGYDIANKVNVLLKK